MKNENYIMFMIFLLVLPENKHHISYKLKIVIYYYVQNKDSELKIQSVLLIHDSISNVVEDG